MTVHTSSPANYYNQQLAIVAQQSAVVKRQGDIVAWLRLFTIFFMVGAIYMGFRQQNNIMFIAVAILLAALLYILARQSQLKEKAVKLGLFKKLLDDELKALSGDHSAFYNGDTYINSNHPYSYDLDLFGNRTLYQVLNRAVTTSGADTLALSLQLPYGTEDEITERQLANRELSGKAGFMHRFRVTGMFHAEEVNAAKNIRKWLVLEDVFLGNKLFAVMLYLVPAMSVLFSVLSIMQGTLHKGLVTMLAVNWIINIRYAKKIKQSHYLVSESIKMVAKTEQLLYEIIQEEFGSAILGRINTDSKKIVSSITELKKLAHLFDNRANGMVGPLLNSLFMFDVSCMMRLEKWRSKHKHGLERSLQLVGEMDMHCSFANYTFNHPSNVYPVIDNSSATIFATDLQHPLVATDVAVGNTFSIGSKEQLYMLTGANMTGKSTLIRTVGTNLILAYVGVPVPAVNFTVPLIRIFTSIRVTDSVQDDVSYFKAELQRMQLLMQEVSNASIPYLILLDEPLRGTNSVDKQAGTKAIVEKLLRFNAIGIIATHDTGLCAMATEHPAKISNYHFESEVVDGGLQFDYKLKSGPSTSSNATLLLRFMGITD